MHESVLLLNHDLEVEVGRHGKLTCVQLSAIDRTRHSIMLVVQDGICINLTIIIIHVGWLEMSVWCLSLRFALTDLPEQPWYVQTLYSILKSLVAVHVSELGPVDSVLKPWLFLYTQHFEILWRLFGLPQGVIDVLMKSYLAFLGITMHWPLEWLNIRLLLGFLVCRCSHTTVDIATTHMRTEDPVVNGGWLGR